MKLTIDRISLLRPLGHVQSVVERRNTIPILANVVLRAEGGELSLTATDMDMDIATEVGCSVMTSGTTTMSAHLLYDIARKLPDGAEVEIAVNDGHAMVSAGRSSFRLPTLPVEDFPAISSNELPVNFSLTAADMRDLIDATRFAISTEETRYYLNGIYIHKAESGELCAVATDGHRLAMTRQALPSGAAQMPSIILPRKAVSELRKLLDDFDGDVLVGLSETRAEFRFGVVRLTSKLIDGTFPDYTRVIPVGNDRIMQVDVSAFSAAVDRVSTVASEKSRAVKMGLKSGVLTLSASNTDASSATEELEVSYDGPEMEIGFNARYLLDIAGQVNSDLVEFVLADQGSPSLVRAPGDEASLFVLMPMRV
ncbi:MAG: DNA polymerase III subunit beta [Alphaproteobacteria bacterium]|nr:DNA polymerase III subunit beta [Porticoccaceae bacterium]MDP4786131.1 DNA polymerase III subunit beta [Alphaproteobacteria bacterium]MDP4925121.1 DNA polymerase III subunit beta [Alphaproteobacteria bacterium]